MSTTSFASADRKSRVRDKRAQGIAAMGLVTREGARFRVSTPTIRGRKSSFEVWRDARGKVRCSCPDYDEQSPGEATFRCEHILAVKHSLLATTARLDAREAARNELPSVDDPRASEAGARFASSTKPLGRPGESGTEQETKRIEADIEVKEIIDNPTTVAGMIRDQFSNVRSLAKPTKDGEKTMLKSQATEHTGGVGIIEENSYTTRNEQPLAPVVSLAFSATLRALRQQVDANVIKTREGWTDGAGHAHLVEYVEWHTVADVLDRVTPTWSHSVRNVVQIGDMVAVTAAITVDGVTREGVGTGTAESEMGIKKAEHDALKRAAVKFGIARELYQREADVIEREAGAQGMSQFPRDPVAKSMAELVTARQLGMIRGLAREAGVSMDETCASVLRCTTEELSKRGASSFIDYLKALQRDSAATGQMRRAS
jgi:hypothetical protein